MTNQITNRQKEKINPLANLLTTLVKLWQAAGWYFLGGFIGAVLLLILFASLTEEVFSQEFTSFDNNIGLWLHKQATPALDTLFTIFTTIGSIPGIIVLTGITICLLWALGKVHTAMILALSVGGGILLNQSLKFLFRRPRPQLFDISENTLTTFSFPSGHSTVSLCYFGVIAWLGWRYFQPLILKLGSIALMAVIVGLVGLSRIYFGVHYPSDVLAGYLSGGFWLVIILNSVTVIKRIRRYSEAKTLT